MNSLYDESPFLEHHGIKGQKWGVRNGPPYPLKLKKRWGFKKIDDSVAKSKRPVTSTSFIRLDNIEPNYNFAKIAVE